MPLFDKNICQFNNLCLRIYTSHINSDKSNYIDTLEHLWNNFEPYASPTFRLQFLRDESKYYSLIWEMFLANKLLEMGYTLLKQHTDDAPDLCILENGKKIWIECAVPNKGTTPNNVPAPNLSGEFIKVDTDKSILRCINTLGEKKKQHIKWLKNNICKPDEAFIIAINGQHLQLYINDNSFPDVLRGLYAIGDCYISFSKNSEETESGYHTKESISKENTDATVDTLFFLKEENSHIDGILFSNDTIGYGTICPKYCFVENIFGKYKLSNIFERFCQTYDYPEGYIRMK